LIAVHRNAHRTAWFAPFGPGRFKDAIQPFSFGQRLTCCEPGTTSTRTPGATWRPLNT